MDAPTQLLIDGEWRDSADGGTVGVENPATGEIVDEVAAATVADLDWALAAADEGWQRWRSTDAWSRSRLLRDVAARIRDHADDLAPILTEEAGKPVAQARAEMMAAAEYFDWFADEARRVYGRTVDGHSTDNRLVVRREPVGPVAAFVAWNFPVLLSARKLAPALAAGCSIVLKPAEESPRAALWLGQACLDAGIPPGVVNLVTGDPARISRHLMGSPVIRKVSLTGSLPVGRTIIEQSARRIIPVSLELGGDAAVLVFPDADIDAAADLCAAFKYRNCGQVCIAPSRFFVHEDIAAGFTERFVAATESLTVGDPSDPGTEVGPLSSEKRLEAVEALVSDAVARGAKILLGGKRPPDMTAGWFYEPTVLTDVHDSMSIMTEEPFGPVAPIATFSSFDEAIERANDTPYGLAGYVFTTDMGTAMRVSEQLEAGLVGVNTLALATAEAPFGGVKQSGFGREGAAEGIDSYLVTKYVNIQL
ncbi:MAG: NAD-dependent succinate-semialdehyde dehydrogenase [Actinobacteria bacterium]|nr:MAG: NAD-dependent succinate-semialdehyde dehydrogenase [Actinomycetota bacterium]RIK04642.1 MAG: NAD-dependent succinate-semialdehyde dehydrogenase [Acidobacteriota bacterium]